jgi:general secretion pathway protein G
MKLNRSKNRIHHHTTRAFTLVEMLLVIVILGTLAAIVYPNVGKQGERARIKATIVQIAAFRNALATFEIDNGHYPKGRTGLQDLVHRPHDTPQWNGPYLDKIPKDPWKNDYIYECPGKHNPETYDLMSMGPDGVAGTEDDITNWEPDK